MRQTEKERIRIVQQKEAFAKIILKERCKDFQDLFKNPAEECRDFRKESNDSGRILRFGKIGGYMLYEIEY